MYGSQIKFTLNIQNNFVPTSWCSCTQNKGRKSKKMQGNFYSSDRRQKQKTIFFVKKNFIVFESSSKTRFLSRICIFWPIYLALNSMKLVSKSTLSQKILKIDHSNTQKYLLRSVYDNFQDRLRKYSQSMYIQFVY